MRQQGLLKELPAETIELEANSGRSILSAVKMRHKLSLICPNTNSQKSRDAKVFLELLEPLNSSAVPK